MSNSKIYTAIIISLTIVIVLYLFSNYHTERNLKAKEPNIKNKQTMTHIKVPVHKIDKLHNLMKGIIKKMNFTSDENKEYQDFLKYKQERDKIINMLPQLSENTYKTTFHVLVDRVPKDENKYKVIVLVSSNAPNFDRRSNIRELWGNKAHWKNHMWRIFFITGGSPDPNVMKKLYIEAETSKDVIIQDIPEDFYHMAKKVMIGMQWAHVNFKYDYILKCDDDIFVHMDHLTTKLKEYHKHTYFGQAMLGQPVERSGRYGVTKAEYEHNTYDPYCSGGGFVMSHDTIQGIIPLFNWEHPLKIDDAYFGGLAFAVGTKATQGDGFYMWNDHCEYHEDVIVVHPVKEKDCMEKMLKQATKPS